MAGGYRDGGVSSGLFSRYISYGVHFFTSRYASAKGGNNIYIHDESVYLLLTHHPNKLCAMGTPLTLLSPREKVPINTHSTVPGSRVELVYDKQAVGDKSCTTTFG